jgi:hypothetical protein
MREQLKVKNEQGETIGTFPLYESAPCALIVETFGQYVMFGNLVVWFNDQDGSAGESYDNFAKIVEERIMRQTISDSKN